MEPTHIRIGAWEADSGHLPSQTGFALSRLEGWSEGVDMDSQSSRRPAGPGTVGGDGQLGERDFAAHGMVYARSLAELTSLGARLTSLAADGLDTRVDVTQWGASTWGMARRAGAPRFQPRPLAGGRVIASWSLQLLARDPRRYGVTRVAGPGVTVPVAHGGSYNADPVVTVTATSAISTYGLRLVQDGVQLGYLRLNALAAGKTHVIDMRSGFVALDGAVTDRQIHSGAPWAIPPCSECTVTLEPVTGAGTVALAFSDTYI